MTDCIYIVLNSHFVLCGGLILSTGTLAPHVEAFRYFRSTCCQFCSSSMQIFLANYFSTTQQP